MIKSSSTLQPTIIIHLYTRFCEWWVNSKRLLAWRLDHVVELFSVHSTGSDSPILYSIRLFGFIWHFLQPHPTVQPRPVFRSEHITDSRPACRHEPLKLRACIQYIHNVSQPTGILWRYPKGVNPQNENAERMVPGTRSTNCDSSSEAPAKQAPPYRQESSRDQWQIVQRWLELCSMWRKSVALVTLKKFCSAFPFTFVSLISWDVCTPNSVQSPEAWHRASFWSQKCATRQLEGFPDPPWTSQSSVQSWSCDVLTRLMSQCTFDNGNLL